MAFIEELMQIEDRLKKEAKSFTRSAPLSNGELDDLYKWSTVLKNICKMKEAEEDGYSQDGGWTARGYYGGHSRDGGYSEAYDRGNSYANRGMHYVRGHYSRDDGRSYDGGYSGDDSMMRHLDQMMAEARTPEEREKVERMRRDMMR